MFQTENFDVGNRVGIPGLSLWAEPMVFHRPPAGFRVEPLSATGAWKLGEQVKEETATIARIREDAAENPEYNVWSSNCEHFTNYAITGERKSPTLQNAVGFVVVAGLIGWGLAELSSA